MNNSNTEVRVALLRAGLHQWELAGMLRVREGTFYKLMSEELPDEVQETLIDAIACIDDLEAFEEIREKLHESLTNVSASRYAERVMRDVEAREILRDDETRYGYNIGRKLGGKYD